jgi:hypothetical protein
MSIEPATKADQEKMSIGFKDLLKKTQLSVFPQMKKLDKRSLPVWVNCT